MMKFVGLHGTNKVTIVMHKMLPPDEHMCLVIYDQKCPPRYYNEIDKLLNNPATFEHKELATSLENTFLNDGRNLAKALYEEGHLKKVATQNIFVTPYGYDSKHKMRLSELNEILEKIEAGGDAAQKMKELDENAGLQMKKQPAIKNDVINESKSLGDSKFAKEMSAIVKTPVIPHDVISIKQDPKEASLELRNQSDMLNTTAVKLLEIAKELKEKAEELFPSAPKRKPGRPKGTFKIVK